MANTQIQSEQIADDAITSAKIAANALGINDLSNATVSSSDPAVTTNPSGGVGTLWINSTSGEAYICTDATSNLNEWINIGAGTGDITPGATGGTESTSGGYKYHTFTSSGTLTVTGTLSLDILLVAGGAGGGGRYNSGGGGAG